MSMTGFDTKKKDQVYAAVLENKPVEMASSHQMKRFFAKLSIVPNKVYQMILHRLFIWRLRIEKPRIIILGIDTMVMDNDSAKKREGVEFTYKKKKGFQPLHICWGPYLIDVTYIDPKSKNSLDQLLAALKAIYCNKKYNQEIFVILEGHINSGKKDTGRTGMDLWSIFVLA